MKQDSSGGYCPRCNTVWVAPGKCNCDPLLAKHEPAISVFEKEVWNAAINACAAEVGKEGWLRAQYLIRKLKKY